VDTLGGLFAFVGFNLINGACNFAFAAGIDTKFEELSP
jgi:hypothetical protein